MHVSIQLVLAAVLQQRDRLRAEVEALQSRLQSLQTAANSTMGAKTDLQGQLSDAQAALAAKEAELVQARSDLQAYKAAADAVNAAGAKAATAQQTAALQQVQAAANAAQQQLEVAQQQRKDTEAKVGSCHQNHQPGSLPRTLPRCERVTAPACKQALSRATHPPHKCKAAHAGTAGTTHCIGPMAARMSTLNAPDHGVYRHAQVHDGHVRLNVIATASVQRVCNVYTEQ
jgi:uncharacterized phage infection (PIP) family protein YhgE